MKKISKRKILKICLIAFFILYVSVIFIKQQHTLNSYSNEKEYISKQIDEQKEYKNELVAKKENVNSKEYIEQIAREKLNIVSTKWKSICRCGKLISLKYLVLGILIFIFKEISPKIQLLLILNKSNNKNLIYEMEAYYGLRKIYISWTTRIS